MTVKTTTAKRDPDEPSWSIRAGRGLARSVDVAMLELAARRWPTWTTTHPALSALDEVAQAPRWAAAAHPGDVDAVLVALAELACPQGGDDLAAAAVLAWMMVPGASRLAAQLRRLSPHIDEVVAAHLWIQARTIGARCRHKVAAHLLWSTRREVLQDLGVTSDGSGWARTRLIDGAVLDRVLFQAPVPEALWWGDSLGQPLGRLPSGDLSQVRLDAVLSRARARGVITDEEQHLLLELAEAAHTAQCRPGRGRGGLTAAPAAALVAARRGVSPRTVRRHATAALTSLTQAADHLAPEESPDAQCWTYMQCWTDVQCWTAA